MRFIPGQDYQAYAQNRSDTLCHPVNIATCYGNHQGFRGTIDQLVESAPIYVVGEENQFDIIVQDDMYSSGLRGILLVPPAGKTINLAREQIQNTDDTTDSGLSRLSGNERTPHIIFDYVLDGEKYIISFSHERFENEERLIEELDEME